jgi:hypothetical protein
LLLSWTCHSPSLSQATDSPSPAAPYSALIAKLIPTSSH